MYSRGVAAGAYLAAAVVLMLVGGVAGCTGGDGTTLDGTGWRVVEWAESEIDPAAFELTASFADGQIGGRSAVNSYGGEYTTTTAGGFAVGMISQTLMAGPEPDMRAEETFFRLLQSASTYERDGDMLTLIDGEGLEALVLERTE